MVCLLELVMLKQTSCAIHAPDPSLFCPRCAGYGPFMLSPPCWSCFGDKCELEGYSGRFGAVGNTSRATATIGVPGGGPYRLRYTLTNGAGPHNSWQASIASVDGSFPAIVLESLVDSGTFVSTARELLFSLPFGTAAVILTFEARQVRHGSRATCTCCSHWLPFALCVHGLTAHVAVRGVACGLDHTVDVKHIGYASFQLDGVALCIAPRYVIPNLAHSPYPHFSKKP